MLPGTFCKKFIKGGNSCKKLKAKMYSKGFFVLLFVPGFYCRPCGEPPVCKCYEPAGLISCEEIEEFPSFNHTDIWNIDMLDIINTSLSKVPDLEGWRNLALLTSIGNSFLDCRDLHNREGHFYIKSDCPMDSLSNTKTVNYQLLWPYFLSIVPFSLLGLVGGYKMMYQNLKRSSQSLKDDEPERVDL